MNFKKLLGNMSIAFLAQGVSLLLRYDRLDKENIGSQLKLGVIYQAIISSLIVAAAFFGIGDRDRLFVIVSTAIYLCINNAAFFMGFVFQMTNETKLFSISVLADKVFFLLALVFLIMFEVRDYKIYTILYIVSRSVALAYCFYRGKEILFAKYLGFKKTFPLFLLSESCALWLTKPGA